MAKLSASWATRRYFWAIAEPLPTNRAFRLSEDARQMDFHQKTLLSDEFGIGMAGLLMEQFLGAGSFVDISVALNAPESYQDIGREGSAQPDFLMWGEEENSPYYIVECKGTQSNKSTSYDQLRRGLEQVPSVVFGAGARPVVTAVVATCLQDKSTDVFVLDPPPDAPEDDHPERESSERVSERTGGRTWQIHNPEAFRKRAVIAEESNLLKWAGQYQTAAVRDQQLEARQPPLMEMPNAQLETKSTDFGNFRGIVQSLFPELGIPKLTMFTGVEGDLLESLIQNAKRRDGGHMEVGQKKQPLPLKHLPGTASVSRSGTCMIIDGL